MDIQAMDGAMLQARLDAAEDGDPGPWVCVEFFRTEEHQWRAVLRTTLLDFLAGTATPADVAGVLVARDPRTWAAFLHHRSCNETMLMLTDALAREVTPERNGHAEIDDLRRDQAARYAFINSERARAMSFALYLALCKAISVRTAATEAWEAVSESQEALTFRQALPVPYAELALGIAVRLMGEYEPDTRSSDERNVDVAAGLRLSDFRELPEGQRADRRLEIAINEYPERFRLALCGYESGLGRADGDVALLRTEVYQYGRRLLRGEIRRDGSETRPRESLMRAKRQAKVFADFNAIADTDVPEPYAPPALGPATKSEQSINAFSQRFRDSKPAFARTTSAASGSSVSVGSKRSAPIDVLDAMEQAAGFSGFILPDDDPADGPWAIGDERIVPVLEVQGHALYGVSGSTQALFSLDDLEPGAAERARAADALVRKGIPSKVGGFVRIAQNATLTGVNVGDDDVILAYDWTDDEDRRRALQVCVCGERALWSHC
jgi:hypothetical protein